MSSRLCHQAIADALPLPTCWVDDTPCPGGLAVDSSHRRIRACPAGASRASPGFASPDTLANNDFSSSRGPLRTAYSQRRHACGLHESRPLCDSSQTLGSGLCPIQPASRETRCPDAHPRGPFQRPCRPLCPIEKPEHWRQAISLTHFMHLSARAHQCRLAGRPPGEYVSLLNMYQHQLHQDISNWAVCTRIEYPELGSNRFLGYYTTR